MQLASPLGIVALAGCALAGAALVLAAATAWRVRALRRDQRVLLGDRDAQDLVHHVVELEAAFRTLDAGLTGRADALTARLADAERGLERTFSRLGVVRYDAYDELAGRQSTTIALLDTTRSGVVLSSLHHRDQVRLYAKQVHEGRGEHQLSPEEEEAVRLASP